MRKKASLVLVPIFALGATVISGAPAFASTGDESHQATTSYHVNTSYHATLDAINGSGGSGSVKITISGDQATVVEEVSGIATTFASNPYPHVQHIHIDAQGVCPPPSADTNGDGIVDTVEGEPFYGMIGTTLSTSGTTAPSAGTDLAVAPTGGSFTYERTFTMNAETLASLEAGTAVVVVHGLDPSTLSAEAQAAPSKLVPSLPLAATAPALCGAVEPTAVQVPDVADRLAEIKERIAERLAEVKERVAERLAEVDERVAERLVEVDERTAEAAERVAEHLAEVDERVADQLAEADQRKAEAAERVAERLAEAAE